MPGRPGRGPPATMSGGLHMYRIRMIAKVDQATSLGGARLLLDLARRTY